MGYQLDPEEEFRDDPTLSVWIIAALAAVTIFGLAVWFGGDLAAATGLGFFDSTLVAVIAPMLAFWAVESLLKKPKA